MTGSPPPPERARPWLDAPERERAAAFRHDRDRDAWVSARGWFREVLATALGRPAADLVLGWTPEGRPQVVDPEGGPAVSLSHAGGHVAVAMAPPEHGPVGVDVEILGPALADEHALRRVMTPAERAEYEGLPPGRRLEWAAVCWTRKEAALKADGRGLRHPPERVDAGGEPGWRRVAVQGRSFDVLSRIGSDGCVTSVAVPHAPARLDWSHA